MERTFLIIIVFIGIGMAVLMSAINGTWRATSFSDYHDDAEIYNTTALLILEKHSFGEEGRGFVGAFRRSPGYPIFLAFSYALLGKTPFAAFFMQALILILSLFLLWSLAGIYFPYPYRLLPPLFLALSWFITLQVTIILPELFTLFLLLFFLWSLFQFFDSRRRGYLGGAGGALAWFILIKPVALYILPFILAIVIAREYARASFLQLGFTLGLLLVIPFMSIGAWTIRSVSLFHTWQIQSGSYVIAWKSLEAAASWRRVAASFVGGLVGDFTADRILPGYADNPDPHLYVKATFDHMRALGAQGLSEAKREAILYQEARERIIANPVKFLVAGITGLLRQNTPMNHRGEAITHARQNLAVLLVIRLIGYALLALILYGAFLHWRDWHTWGFVLIWFICYNLLYGFFTHNEARYMIPLWPLYFLLLTAALARIFSLYGKRLRTPLSQS